MNEVYHSQTMIDVSKCCDMTMKKITSPSNRQKKSSMVCEDRWMKCTTNQDGTCCIDGDTIDNDAIKNSDSTMSYNRALRHSINSFQSTECCYVRYSCEVSPPKYPRRRLNSVDIMNDIGNAEQSLVGTKESSLSSVLTSQTSNCCSINDEQMELCMNLPRRISPSLGNSSLIGMEIIINHNDNHKSFSFVATTTKQNHDSSPISPRRAIDEQIILGY